MSVLEKISESLQKGDAKEVEELVKKAINENIPAVDILNEGLIRGMNVLGVKFKNNEVFIPEVLVAAQAMKAGVELIKPLLSESNVTSKGKFMIGTVKGDLHDIGKNLVIIMMKGAGFDVVDLGVNVSKEKFIEAIVKENPDILGMSALLTTTMTYMKEVIDELQNRQLRDKIKVIVGGAPITAEFAEEIGADGYSPDAGSAVELVSSLI